MEVDSLLWLLLPVAAASGWFAARGSALLSAPKRAPRQLSSDYLKGLDYLLNEQPDKALDVFIKLIEVDSDTVETHLALGALFRRRGEVNRAIRIHQNLMTCNRLNQQQRALAMLELGQDYRRAGLLDRAEILFADLIKAGCYKIYAYRQLLEIYQQEHDWDKAIQTAEALAAEAGENLRPVIAQFHCELVEQYRRQGNLPLTDAVLQQALKLDPACVRASLLQARLAFERGDTQVSIRALQQVEHQNPTYLPEIIAPLEQCYRANDDEEAFAAYLQYLLERYGGVTPALSLSSMIEARQGKAAALEFIVGQLRQRPSLRGLAHFLGMTLPDTRGTARETLSLLQEIVGHLLQNRPVYKCEECGFAAKSLYWQCPGCKHWNTVKPIHGLEGE